MSCHRIIMKGGHKVCLPVLSRDDYLMLRGSRTQGILVAAVRRGEEDKKPLLLQMNYSCLPNEDGTLKGSKTPSNSVGMDIDHVPHSHMQMLREVILQKKDELGLLMLELSARGSGYHLVFRRRPELSQEENLRWASHLLGVDYDKGAKDITRVFFTTTASEEDLIYLSDSLFEINEVKNEELRMKNEEKEPQAPSASSKGVENDQKAFPREGLDGAASPSSQSLAAFDLCVQQAGLKPDEMDVWGEHNWHNNLMAVLSVGVAKLMSRDQLEAVIRKRLPNYSQTEDCKKLIDYFYANYSADKGWMSSGLRKINAQAQQPLHPKADLEDTSLPPMPQKLPQLIQLLTSKTPDCYKAALAHAIFPPLATHLCNVRFRYTDNVDHEATLMNCLMASTGAGKGCIDEPIKRIMADIKLRDRENERREAEWKKDCQKKGANKDKMVRPEGLVIQIIDPDMTKPALVTRMDEAEGHFVYVKLNELDLFDQLRGATGKQHFQLMCLAFDPGAEYGQTRIGTQSVTARPQCRFNWNACTTILKGRRFFRNVLTDGPISRINFCTIPEMEIGSEQPVYGQYDAAFDEALKPYIDNLVSARGLVDCPQAYKLAKQLQQECAEFARLSQDEVYWNLSHRACVIAWLKACVLYVANGMKWEKSIEDFIRWSLHYDLWCKMQFFGADIEKANQGEDTRITTRGPRNLLELLPDEFTLEDAKRVRMQQGLGNEGRRCQRMLSNWKSRGYVTQISDISFQKSKNTWNSHSHA
ncbi:MAG: hypothetical protein IJL50_08175 [Bacteroidaceae bacterium]|nr:hypothetical protein [Bacteroidaceae bacterium]